MKKGFFKLKTPKDVYKIIETFPELGNEIVNIKDSLNRMCFKDIYSDVDLPNFNRSTVDGYAIKAKDSFGASESTPVFFKIIGEIKMGEKADYTLNDGEAIRISTGGMLPQGSDAIVMLEYTNELDKNTLEARKSVSPLENVIQVGDDIKKGQLVIKKGFKVRPQDIGMLAAIGKKFISVYKRPKVAIISTGDELSEIDKEIPLGKIRDVNSYTLSSLIKEVGAESICFGIVKDKFLDLKKKCEEALNKADIILISGGSSVGTMDITLDVINSFPYSEILVHGISVSPGKPTILAKVGNKAVWGLPGHVVSAMIVFLIFIKSMIKKIGGYYKYKYISEKSTFATLTKNIAKAQGREDYTRVKLFKGEDGIIYAEPILGKSGLISSMVKADGIIRIDMNSEGIEAGEKVEVILF